MYEELEALLTEEATDGPFVPFTFIGGYDEDDQPTFQIEEQDICLN